MSFGVRIYGYRGLARIPVSNDGGTAGSDSVYVLEQPYLWGQTVTASGTTAISTAAAVPTHYSIDPTRLLRVEVPDGQAIRYEVSMTGNTVTASASSPLLTGRDQIQFGPNALIAMVDASAV